MECESPALSPVGGGSSKPPDGSTQQPHTTFKDKLMGGSPGPQPQQFEDLIEKGKMKVVYANDNPLLPKIVVDREVIENMVSPWKNALVISLLGKKLGYRLMKNKLMSLWRLSGECDLIDVDNGFYIVKFDREVDRDKVIGGGPWMIFDHYLAVSTWSPEFISPAARVKKTLAWIRIPGLNVAFFNESYLLSAARVIGKPVKLDRSTLRAERGRFARICVELDLNKPVIGKICLEEFWYNIEYEGLHVICTKCGCYGHRTRECSGMVIPVEKPTPAASASVQTAVGNVDGGAMEIQHESDPLPQEAVSDSGVKGGVSIDDVIEVERQSLNANDESGVEALGEWMTVVKRKKKEKVNKPEIQGDSGE
ncbi:uncharacterized protein LOC130724985 [Lotus japonicus]|uniref:uncharacterized protein LOC130724985 n=1 Tax=Lotus japonicus TaxID=34305 RepID=UPI002588FE3E|nr:uncharacterized protein LOC130724985 [Lotus japonicus]